MLSQLTTSPFGHDIPIGFAPDGSSIAFTRDGRAGSAGTLFLADPDGSHVRPLGNLAIGGGDWAPDGRSILITSSGQLFSVDAATGQATPHVIVGNPTAKLWNPQRSPDGTRILFRMKVNNVFDFYTMRSDGTDVFQLTNEPEDSSSPIGERTHSISNADQRDRRARPPRRVLLRHGATLATSSTAGGHPWRNPTCD